MELSFLLLLCVAGCSLSHALPIQVQETEIRETHPDYETKTVFEVKPTPNTDTYLDNDNRTVFDVNPTADTETHPDNDNRTIFGAIEAANKDVSNFLKEGDINLSRSRSAKSCSNCLWIKSPNGIVEVPYVISSDYTDDQRSVIAEALMEFQVMTCVQLVTRTTQTDYLSLESDSGCWSYVGRKGGKQTVSLSQDRCIKNGIVQHEIMHNLGFYHEHTRTDRDNYIDIMWENVSPDEQSNFEIDDGNTQSLPYDYSSVMHYDKYTFSNAPNKPTIITKPDPSVPIGQRIGMDNLDVMRINKLYNCNLCRTKLINTSGSFSYSSTASGQGGSSCLWLIQSTSKVLLQLSDINVPSSPDCSDSYINVYDGASKLSPVLLITCGNGEVPPLISSGKNMLVEFVNNKPEIMNRFKASYNTLKYGGTYLSETGVVSSPLFPMLYPSNLDIVWSIIAPKGCKVLLTFNFFRLRKPCSLDYLIVRDGPSMTSPVLGTFCGYIPSLAPVVSSGNMMILQFHSGADTGYNGFTSTYKCVTGN